MLLTVFVPAKSFKVKRQPQSSEPAWTGWALAATLLLGYPLSFGPFLILIAYGILPSECLLLYFPLILLGQVLHPVLTLMHWSVHFCIRLLF